MTTPSTMPNAATPAPTPTYTGAGARSMPFGAFAWWNFDDCNATPDELRSIVAAAGRADIVIPDIDAVSELRRIGRVWRNGRGKATRHRAEIAHDDGNTITVGILTPVQRAAKVIGWDQIDAVTFDATTGACMSSGTTDAAADFLAAAGRVMSTYDNRFVRPLIVRIFAAMGACKLQRNGSLHFVPFPDGSDAPDRLAELERIVARIGACSLDVVPQDSSAARATAGRGVSRSILDEIDDLNDKIDGYMSDDRQRAVSGSAVDNLLSAFGEIAERADLYRDALALRLDDVNAALDAARDRARALISNDNPTDAAADMSVRQSIVDVFDRLTDMLDDDADGVMVATAGDLETAGVCASGRRWAKYYRAATAHTRAGNGYRALAALGYRGSFDETACTLTITPIDNGGDETAAADDANAAA